MLSFRATSLKPCTSNHRQLVNIPTHPRGPRPLRPSFYQNPSFAEGNDEGSVAVQSTATDSQQYATSSSTSFTRQQTSRDTANELSNRHRQVLQHFPTALGIDDFIARTEVALGGYGFTGDNSIAMTNLCRDEITTILKDKIESVFGSSFNTNGLGGVLTCGVTGIKAGLSHSPVCTSDGRERYVFFTFPHIAINSEGEVGAIQRPGRAAKSCACGALIGALGELKSGGVGRNCKVPGVHDPLNPEYSILKQRLARRLRYEQLDIQAMDLTALTHVAERTITDDLEYLIEKCVDPEKADYVVVAGVQIHNWATSLNADSAPSLEFVAPSRVYAVVNGVKTHLDLLQVPALTPRQLMLLTGSGSPSGNNEDIEGPRAITYTGTRSSTLQEVPLSYLNKRVGGASNGTSQGVPMNGAGPGAEWPSWQSKIRRGTDGNAAEMERDRGAPTMDSQDPARLLQLLGVSPQVLQQQQERQNANTSFSTRGSVN